MHDENLSEKRRNALKMAILTKKSKIFIKAKLMVSKIYLLGLVYEGGSDEVVSFFSLDFATLERPRGKCHHWCYLWDS